MKPNFWSFREWLFYTGFTVHIKGPQVRLSKERCTSVPEDCFNLIKLCRLRLNAALCSISSLSSTDFIQTVKIGYFFSTKHIFEFEKLENEGNFMFINF